MAMQFSKAAQLKPDQLLEAVIQQQKLEQQAKAQEQAARQGNYSAATAVADLAPEGFYEKAWDKGTDKLGDMWNKGTDKLFGTQEAAPMVDATPAYTAPTGPETTMPFGESPATQQLMQMPGSESAATEGVGSLMDQQLMAQQLGGTAEAAETAKGAMNVLDGATQAAEVAEGLGTAAEIAETANTVKDAATVGSTVAGSTGAGGLTGALAAMGPLGWMGLLAAGSQLF